VRALPEAGSSYTRNSVRSAGGGLCLHLQLRGAFGGLDATASIARREAQQPENQLDEPSRELSRTSGGCCCGQHFRHAVGITRMRLPSASSKTTLAAPVFTTRCSRHRVSPPSGRRRPGSRHRPPGPCSRRGGAQKPDRMSASGQRDQVGVPKFVEARHLVPVAGVDQQLTAQQQQFVRAFDDVRHAGLARCLRVGAQGGGGHGHRCQRGQDSGASTRESRCSGGSCFSFIHHVNGAARWTRVAGSAQLAGRR
jgi:hypothetical protein